MLLRLVWTADVSNCPTKSSELDRRFLTFAVPWTLWESGETYGPLLRKMYLNA